RFYEFDDAAQPLLREGFLDAMCFQRRADYFPVDLSAAERARCSDTPVPPAESLSWNGRPLLYSFTLNNEYLPGVEREVFKSMGSLFDYRVNRDGSLSYRLNDRLLRSNHSGDAPFALEDFPVGVQFYGNRDDVLVPLRSTPYATSGSFSDSDPSRYQNPHLPFGSAAVPNEGLNFQLAEPGAQAPADAKVKVYFNWDR